MTASSEPAIAKIPLAPRRHDAGTHENNALANASDATKSQLLLANKFITHQVKSGLNPLVDAAAYLFSVIGKLKQLKSYRHLAKLHKELVSEVNNFQESAKAQGYSSEYILVSRYALCATLDDIIANTPWGGQGQWDSYNLLTVYNQEAMSHDRFFIILERLIKDSTLYIDVIELMYICLSLGFKGNYRTTEFGNTQLEQITNALYKRIRAHHGDTSKTLSPYPIKAVHHSKPTNQRTSPWLVALATVVTIWVLFVGMGYMLDTISNQAYQVLMHIGKSILYETDHS